MLLSCVNHHVASESPLCFHTYQQVTWSVYVCVCRSVCLGLMHVCLCIGMCFCALWGWCGMEVTSVRSNIRAHAVMWRALSRDNHEAAQVQLPSVLLFLCGTHTHRYMHIHIGRDTHANTPMLSLNWDKRWESPPGAKAPGMYSLFKTNATAYLLTICLLVSRYVTPHVEMELWHIFVAQLVG